MRSVVRVLTERAGFLHPRTCDDGTVLSQMLRAARWATVAGLWLVLLVQVTLIHLVTWIVFHPRVRGEHAAVPDGGTAPVGIIPRPRGAPVVCQEGIDHGGTIPASAGSTSPSTGSR